ncbi:DUF2188 domain-containing protein [Caulobacter sp. UC70_42]|uniref:DUF2188 domain-containing protein n=1 Tax=Caulobacter sp. UC70_42 TaxID=3374551 RepID=UPI003756D77B
MTCIFHVSPFDGGWCVKICDTGEVLFFKTGGEAERQARRLAAAYPGPSEVRVHDREGRRIGRWIDGASVLDGAASSTSPPPLVSTGAVP